jgi:hypothetical protein
MRERLGPAGANTAQVTAADLKKNISEARTSACVKRTEPGTVHLRRDRRPSSVHDTY